MTTKTYEELMSEINSMNIEEALANAEKCLEAFTVEDIIEQQQKTIDRQKAEIERLEKLDKLAERSIDASTAVINELRSEIALLNDANTNLQDLYQAEKSKVSKKQEKLIMAYRKLQTAKAEAVKEFEERAIKNICEKVYAPTPVQSCIVEKCNQVIIETAKEMVGEG